MTFHARRSSSRVPFPMRNGASLARVRPDGVRSAFAAVLVAVALLVGGASAAARTRDALLPSIGHAIVDGSAPLLHVAAGWPSVIRAHAPRRSAGHGPAAWPAARHPADAASARVAAPATHGAASSHSVAAAGFDATAPPAA